MIAKLQKVLKKLPKSIDEYVRTVTLLSDSDFYPTSLQACQRVPEYQSILQRFFDEDVPFVTGNALKYWTEGLRERVHLLSNADHQVIEFSRDEVIQMMSCMTLGCFDGGMKQVNFLQWQSNYECDNFLLMEEYLHQMRSYPRLQEKVIIETKNLTNPETIDSLISSSVPLTSLNSELVKRIEDVPKHAFIDFANKYIGGSSLLGASAQEEILFSIFPECCLSCTFCNVMTNTQAIIIRGCVRIGTYTGYGGSFKYLGPFEAASSLPSEVIAIDANPCGHLQFEDNMILRDINKAFCGFSLAGEEMDGIASGKWGCGVFGGNPYLKVLQQWIAASLAGKDVVVKILTEE
ncbi:hypothetical protein WA171_001972 [Blastocystis sp. BT1]